MIRKYPRTMHFNFSPRCGSDDKILENTYRLMGIELIHTEKLDGSGVKLTSDAIHARSQNGPPTHESYAWAKKFWAENRYNLIKGKEYFFEYCYAVHSIKYFSLDSYLFLIGVRDGDMWYSWDRVEQEAKRIGVKTVPLIGHGTYGSYKALQKDVECLAAIPGKFGPKEGVVTRVARDFYQDEFKYCVGKMVREDFRPGNEHWSKGIWEKQELISYV